MVGLFVARADRVRERYSLFFVGNGKGVAYFSKRMTRIRILYCLMKRQPIKTTCKELWKYSQRKLFSVTQIHIPVFLCIGTIEYQNVNNKAKPHGCCIFSMILHEAPSMETTTPKGEWFPCWVAEWSIMENMQQQMWFCFYPSPISIYISSYVYNALRLTPEIWFWAMPFASFQIDIKNKYCYCLSALPGDI